MPKSMSIDLKFFGGAVAVAVAAKNGGKFIVAYL